MARRIYYDHFTICFQFQHFDMFTLHKTIVLELC